VEQVHPIVEHHAEMGGVRCRARPPSYRTRRRRARKGAA
jgi:hypothetical protein